jgi:hypothetical protein
VVSGQWSARTSVAPGRFFLLARGGQLAPRSGGRYYAPTFRSLCFFAGRSSSASFPGRRVWLASCLELTSVGMRTNLDLARSPAAARAFARWLAAVLPPK